MAQKETPLRDPETGNAITRNEVLDVLADEGYSAADRKAWLRKVLTRISKSENSDPDRAALVDEIKTILKKQVPGEPKADDTL